MRKLIVGFACSLDGYIEGPNGEYDWIIYDKEQQKEVAQSWKDMDAMFYGRKTYEVSLAMQSNSKTKNNPFAHMKHYVFSNTLDTVADEFILMNGDIKTDVEKIKHQPGKNIAVFGGAELACSLLNLGLVDELELAIMPVVLGKGKPFFSNIDKRLQLQLKTCKQFASGVVRLVYDIRKAN